MRKMPSSHSTARAFRTLARVAVVLSPALLLASCTGNVVEPSGQSTIVRAPVAATATAEAPMPMPIPQAEDPSPAVMPPPDSAEIPASKAPASTLTATPQPEAAATTEAPEESVPWQAGASDDERLRVLAAERARIEPEKSYLIGSGDLIEINVFDVAEMNRKVRVATSGFIQLPLIGAVRATGRTESDLAQEIAERLNTNFVQNPQVNVFVEEYKSQQVAVTGSVSKPGLYPLTKDRYTILDVISEAGGLTKEAGSIIEFVPAQKSGGRSAAFEVATAGGHVKRLGGDEGAEAITIDLNELLRGANRSMLGFSVVAGDVVYVPEAGSFTIEGWVDKPGTYPITRRMTVLAALSAGGGPLLPSKLGQVQLLRAKDGGGNIDVAELDLNAVRDGQARDTELRSGDIVRVPGSALLMVPWGFYSVIKGLVSIGASIPIF